jgi:hypothetical protein
VQRVAISVDFSLTAIAPFFKSMLGEMRNSSEFVIMASTASEIGNRLDNYRYRARQLQKMGIADFDFLVVVDEENPNQGKKAVCTKLGINLVLENKKEGICLFERIA